MSIKKDVLINFSDTEMRLMVVALGFYQDKVKEELENKQDKGLENMLKLAKELYDKIWYA